MPDEKPLPGKRQKPSTKELAERVEYGYYRRVDWLSAWKGRLVWLLLVIAGLAAVTFSFGWGATRNPLSPGPLSSPHALIAQRCETCHATAFRRIADSACLKCHDGPAHPAKAVDNATLNNVPRCVQCHIEHRGDVQLKKVTDANCTACHRNLDRQALGVKLKNVSITGFRPGRHPEFSPEWRPDLRPLKLNHAAHMPADIKTIRNMKLPIHCADCHVTDRNSPAGNLIPVTFEQNCKSCHARELEFDVYGLLKTGPPAPHTKDPATIHKFILHTYTKLLDEKKKIELRPLGNDTAPQPDRTAWLTKVVADSEAYLFGSQSASGVREGKCSYCHEFTGHHGIYPIVAKVNRIQGRYQKENPEGEPWFQRAEYSHRAHRSIECESCHTQARASSKTADVLIPAMKQCLPCHTDTRAGLDGCSECHLYHNKSLEKEERRSVNEILSVLVGSARERVLGK